jgi:hypothetical protein
MSSNHDQSSRATCAVPSSSCSRPPKLPRHPHPAQPALRSFSYFNHPPRPRPTGYQKLRGTARRPVQPVTDILGAYDVFGSDVACIGEAIRDVSDRARHVVGTLHAVRATYSPEYQDHRKVSMPDLLYGFTTVKMSPSDGLDGVWEGRVERRLLTERVQRRSVIA